MMALSGPSGKIHFVSADCPGSYHDSFIFENSKLFKLLHDKRWLPFPGAMILGDSAYKRNYWFMVTPFLQAQLTDDIIKQFNQAISASRAAVENCFGQLKKRFFCLKGGLRYVKMKKSAEAIQTLCAMHNFIKKCNNPEDEFVLQPEDLDNSNQPSQDAAPQHENNIPANRRPTNELLLETYFR